MSLSVEKGSPQDGRLGIVVLGRQYRSAQSHGFSIPQLFLSEHSTVSFIFSSHGFLPLHMKNNSQGCHRQYFFSTNLPTAA